MEPLTLEFEIDIPQELSAGYWGSHDEVTITVKSGRPGGEEGEFAEALRQFLREWYDVAPRNVRLIDRDLERELEEERKES